MKLERRPNNKKKKFLSGQRSMYHRLITRRNTHTGIGPVFASLDGGIMDFIVLLGRFHFQVE